MDSLYARSEDTVARSIISGVPLERLLLALSRVAGAVLGARALPAPLRPPLLLRALRILRGVERARSRLELGFARPVPHPGCGGGRSALGELWELPRAHEWLCADCGTPLYDIENENV